MSPWVLPCGIAALLRSSSVATPILGAREKLEDREDRALNPGFLANLSIRNKLIGIILISTLLSLALGFSVVIHFGIEQFEDDLVRTTETITSAVGNYAALALAFEDKSESAQALLPVRRLADVTDVYLYLYDEATHASELFDWYTRSGELDLPPRVLPNHTEIRQDSVHCFRPVVFEGKRYGTIYVRVDAASLGQRVSEYLVYMGSLMAGVLVLAGLLAYLLQTVISKPILDLAEAARRISADADYSLRVEAPGSDEIGVLYDGFNTMLEQIQQRQEELERSNRDLDQFAYVASHDLKAPLRAISTLAGWIEEDLEDSITDDSREQLRLMRSRVHRMDGLIEGILQYSRVGRLETGVESVDVGRMVRELVDVLDPPKGMEIRVAEGMPVIETKRLRLEQVFLNLISNAIKYHDRPDEGRIDVHWQKQGDVYRFSVADDGPGIDPKHHDRVFLMFQTLQPRDTVESTGLGLSLVTKLVEEEGGEVRVDSELGEGAEFFFTWPAEPVPSTGSRPSPAPLTWLDVESGSGPSRSLNRARSQDAVEMERGRAE